MRESDADSSLARDLPRLARQTWRIAWFTLIIGGTLVACDGAGCGSGCGSEGFEQRPFPDEHADRTIERAGQIRVTDTGLTFLESEIPNIITEVLPNGLNFCVPKTSASGADICVDSTCQNGSAGCQFDFNLADTALTPDPSDTIEVGVTVGGVDEDIPFDALGGECVAHLHEPGESSDTATEIDASVPITFTVQQDSPTRKVQIELGTVDADISESALAIDIDARSGGWSEVVCGGADIDFVKGLIRGELESQFKDRINSAVQQAADQQLCRKCGDMATACPAGSSCQPLDSGANDAVEVCQWDNQDDCVGRALGLEGEFSIGELIGQPHEPQQSNIDTMLTAADHAEVVSGGLDLAMREGAVPNPTSNCVPSTKSTRPDLDDVSLTSSILSNTKPDSSDSFMVGLGLHDRGIDYALWSMWASGGLCLKVGSDFNSLLSTSSLGLFLTEIQELSPNGAPLFLRFSPQTPPTVELGENNITSMDDMRSIEDPLVTLNWEDLDIHFYVYGQNRFFRMFTLRTDITFPIGLATDGPSTVVPVVGDIQSAADNIRVRNDRLITASESSLRDLLPTLLGTIGPELSNRVVQPFDLPSFFGYRVALDQDDITSVDDGSFLALYADFMRVSNLRAISDPPAPKLKISEMRVSREGEIPQPRFDVALTAAPSLQTPAADTTYLWRLNEGLWHEFDPGSDPSTLTIDHPVLALQGTHELEVKARRRGSADSTWSPSTTRQLSVDLGPPTIADLSIDRPDAAESTTRLTFDLSDAVASEDALHVRMRWRSTDGEASGGSWTGWRDASSLPAEGVSLANLPGWSADSVPGQRIRLDIQAKDPAGHETTETTTVKLTEQQVTASGGQSSATGCRSTGSDSSTPPWGHLMFMVLGILSLIRRRHSTSHGTQSSRSRLLPIAGAVVLVGAAVCLAGCPDSSSQGPCDGNCQAWETCEGGVCAPETCSSAEDCAGDAHCREGQCWPCTSECGSGEYCCHESASCESLPDPCSDTSCDPGFEPTVSESADINTSTCKATGGACECTEKPPIDLAWYGSHVDADVHDGIRAVASYNQAFGDLQIGILDNSLEPTWYLPDGVPDEGTVVAAPSGPRGGIEDEGEDVGTHTSLAIDDAGRLHVFYRHEETGALTYARAQTNPDEQRGLETEILDDIDSSGTDNAMFTATAIRDGTVHALYSVREVENDQGQLRSQIRSVSFPVDTPFDQLDPAPAVVFDSPPHNPCGAGCDGEEVCFEASGACAMPDDTCGSGDGDGSCDAEGSACQAGTCEPVYTEPSGTGHPLMTGVHTELHVTPDGGLLAVFFDNIREQIGWMNAPAEGDWGEPTFMSEPSGPYADGTLDDDGNLHLAYMDPETRELRYRRTSGVETAQPETDGQIHDGIRTGAARSTARIGHNVRIWLDDNTPHTVFHDPTDHALLEASREPDGSWVTSALATPEEGGAYTGARGFYATGAQSGPDSNAAGIAVEQIIDQTADRPQAELEFHALP